MEDCYWDKNLKEIEKYRSTLKKFINNSLEKQEEELKVKNVEGKVIPFYKNKPLYSVHGLNKQIEEIIEKGKKDLKKRVILIFGFGFGYLLERILDLASHDTIIITIDGNMSLMKEALKYRDLRRVLRDPRLIMGILGDDPKKLSTLLSPHIDGILTGGIGIFFDPSINIFEKKFYDNLKKELIDYIRTISIHFNTISTLEFAFTQNTFFNVPYYVLGPGIQVFKHRFDNIPAIIVSAGPSLNKNIDQLKYAKGKALIISLGPTFKPLLEHKVMPDFVVTVDPVDLQVKMFQGKEEETKKSILITLPFFNFKAFKLWKGKVLWMGKDEPLINFFDEASGNFHDRINTGMTVAHSAFSFANYIGANPIILVGQDLSYPADKTHVDGAPHIRKIEIDPSKVIWVEGNYEEKVPTVRNLFSYIYLFEEMAKKVKIDDPKKILVNATEGGAKIKGFDIMSFKEAQDSFISKRYRELENGILHREIPDIVSIDREKLFKRMNEAISDFYIISRLSYDLIKKIKELPSNPGVKEIEKLNKEIVKVQREIISKKYFELFKTFFEVYERKKIKREKILEEKYRDKSGKENFLKEVEDQKKKSITYYSEIFTIANYFGNMMEFAKDKIKEKLKVVDSNNERR